MSLWFTSDPHFMGEDTLAREHRPFTSAEEFSYHVIDIWNEQVKRKDIIYVIGDFVSYTEDGEWKRALQLVKQIKARVVLITGNNEESVIVNCFNGSLSKFRDYCIRLGFVDVLRSKYLRMDRTQVYLTHMPMNHDPNCITLFGHVHKGVGLYKPYGFNMFLDLNYFRLFGEQDIVRLLETKKRYWDKSLNFNDKEELRHVRL